MSYLSHVNRLRRAGVVAVAGLALASLWVPVQAADPPAAAEFAWRGVLSLPAGATLARVEVPVAALMQMQSATAQDVRIFNAAGAVVPFSVLGGHALSQAAEVLRTARYPAYPLFSAVSAGKPLRGAVEVQVDSGGQRSSAWVRFDPPAPVASAAQAGAQPLQAVLLDTRTERSTVDALELSLDLPHNALVPVTVSTSTDLKDWTVLATQGPVFQFDGADAPSNTTLVLRQPVALFGRYLRLAWPGQTGVSVRSLVARVAATQTLPAPLRAAVPPGAPDGDRALRWSVPFATPVAALHLQALQDNTLLPVRIQGRADAAQPWRTLATAVVYRLDTVGQGSSNPPTPLHGASVRALRVEAAADMALPPGGLQATVEFAPLQLAFLASGAGPFTLAVGRAQTPAAAVDASLLGAVSPARLNALPLATFASVEQQPAGALAGAAAAWLPAGTSLRSVLLWLVLGLGVLVLGAVAYSLVRQLAARR